MPMEIDRKQLKQRAREAMSLSKPSFWVVTLVYLLMTTGVSSLADFAPGMMGSFLSIALTLYCWVVAFSYRLWALWTARRLEPDLGSLMDGFSVAGRVIFMEIGIMARIFGWTLLLVVPVTLFFSGPLLFAGTSSIALVLYLILLCVVAVLVEVIMLRYSLAPYVLADYPDLGPSIAIAHSVRLTKGWRWELFKLQLSFLGWYLLSGGLTVIGLAVGTLLTGGAGLLSVVSPDQLGTQLAAIATAPIPALLGNLLCLPVMLYFTPYLEVTMAEFYNARIALNDNMANPMAGVNMPPL